MKSTKRGSRRNSKSEYESASAPTPKTMSYDEMIAADPIEATETSPPYAEPSSQPMLFIKSELEPELIVRADRLDLLEGQNIWGISVESPDGPLLAGLPGERSERLSLEVLAHAAINEPNPEPYRPPWLRGTFFPCVAPRRWDGLAGRLARILLPGNFGFRPLISEQLSRDWPWCTVGKVWFSREGHDLNRAGKSSGTGVLVGRNLMLTVSHGAPWGRGPGDWWMEFVPAYASGADPEPFGKSYVESFVGVVNNDDVTGLDYVICKLYTPLGDRCGWMGSASWSDEDPYYDGTWLSIGYPGSFMGGQRPAVEFSISVRDIDDEDDGLEIETVKFAEKGWSGGPLWGWIGGEPRVIGIESGYEKDGLDPTRTVFAGGQHMVNLVKFGIANWA